MYKIPKKIPEKYVVDIQKFIKKIEPQTIYNL